jgi:5-methylcytosine-specific restriction endonuclease McrA
MKWKRIPKENCIQPSSGTCHEWKAIIAAEGFFQCVYCAIHESSFGGTRNFHVEHYRPKSKFRHLEHDIINLFYACAICNTFKGDDWPDEPLEDLSNPSYPDPSKTDYNELFNYTKSVGALEGKFVTSKYLIEKLYLNRPQLIIERRMSASLSRLRSMQEFIDNAIPALESNQCPEAKTYLVRLAKVINKISKLQNAIRKLRPYDEEDIKRART